MPLPVVLVVVVLVTVVLVVASIGVGMRAVERHRSRTSDQASTVFALQMALYAMVQASRPTLDGASQNGHGPARPGRGDGQARETVLKQLQLVEDVQLRQITGQLLEHSRRLESTTDAAAAAQLQAEVDSLQERFRERTTAVVRAINLRRLQGRG
ncbi:MAG TPA: hypothetical protein VHH09_05210 [Acidimicrobiales bacterium]|nr:hypothetical protein [Acidimicrobiales bacterium]